MIGRFEVHRFGVAKLTTERWIDLGVTDEAVRHAGHGSGCDGVGFSQAAVTGFAGIGPVEVGTEIAGRQQIGLRIDRLGEDRCGVAEFQMGCMREAVERSAWRGRNRNILVAGEADFLIGEKIILHADALRGGRVALSALSQLGVETVRERPGRLRRGRDRGHPQKN
jgi:hypothetical protein